MFTIPKWMVYYCCTHNRSFTPSAPSWELVQLRPDLEMPRTKMAKVSKAYGDQLSFTSKEIGPIGH